MCLCCGLNLSLVKCFFELVSSLFAIVPEHGNEYMTKENKIGRFQKYHNTLCLSFKILHKHCFYFLLGLTMFMQNFVGQTKSIIEENDTKIMMKWHRHYTYYIGSDSFHFPLIQN